MKYKPLKYKEGIEDCDYLAISNIDGREFMYKENNLMNLKGYLTRIGVKTKHPLTYFNLVPNPYKNMPRCFCKICGVAYKDSTNYCGVLTNHITSKHNITIKQYTDEYPEEIHLFRSYLREKDREELFKVNENKVLCPLCNQYFKSIKVAHTLNVHNMTLQEFKEVTGVDKLISELERNKHRDRYYSEKGLLSYTKGISRDSVKDYIKNVSYHTYDTKTLIKEGAHFIYKLTSPSGKCYIGRTLDFFHRMYEHEFDAKKGEKDYVVYRAVKKYGWDNFTKEIIDIAKDKTEAIKKELRWIEEFNSYENGYNSTKKTEGGFDWSTLKGTEKYDQFIKTIKDQRKGLHTLQYFQDKFGEIGGEAKFKEKLLQLAKGREAKKHNK